MFNLKFIFGSVIKLKIYDGDIMADYTANQILKLDLAFWSSIQSFPRIRDKEKLLFNNIKGLNKGCK